MRVKIKKRNSLLIALSGVIIYIVFIIIAMFFYAGGTKMNPTSPGYSIFANTFSDLGRFISWNGNLNILSMILFTIAYGTHAFTILFLYLSFPVYNKNNNLYYKISIIGSIFGLISSIAFVGIILTPADLYFEAHWLFVYIGYPAIFIMGICYSFVLIANKEFKMNYGIIFLLMILTFFISLIFGLIGISVDRTIMATGQKIARIGVMVAYIIIIYESLLKTK